LIKTPPFPKVETSPKGGNLSQRWKPLLKVETSFPKVETSPEGGNLSQRWNSFGSTFSKGGNLSQRWKNYAKMICVALQSNYI